MRFAYFTHSLASCWNHGNAHFLRGVLRELVALGHQVRAYEPGTAWSRENLVADHGPEAAEIWREFYPELETHTYPPAEIEDADVVIVHEWNDPALVASIGAARKSGAAFKLLFHDTHHRAVSDPDAMRRYDLSGYDGILAFGQALAEIYRAWGWGARAHVWHEAADTRLFRPPTGPANRPGARQGAVWIGNWGDGERTAEIEHFLLAPTMEAGLALDIFGVRYPAEARDMLARYGALYCGWLPNPRAPEIFARHMMTMHIPRRFYSTVLPGIPTIRVFEALACGIPLVSAPWSDSEGLFTPGPGLPHRRHRRRNDHPSPHPPKRPGAPPIPRRPRPRHHPRPPHLRPPRPRTPRHHRHALMHIAFYGSSLLSSYWNGAATYYRGLLGALAPHGHTITFYEPDAFDRQQHRDIDPPAWARSVVYPATAQGLASVLAEASQADVVIKASGVGVFDDELLRGTLAHARPGALKIFMDVDAAATLETVRATPDDPMHEALRHLDLVLTYGGGPPVIDAYTALGARRCVPIYNALDPATHHPAPPDPRFTADLSFLANRLPDREARVEAFFLSAAAACPDKRFLLGGNGWHDKPMPANVRAIGHVGTADHNAFNGSSLAVLNVARDSMANIGFSPATRVFEAAGAGACLITDAWEGIELFLTPGEEVLVAHDGAEVAAHLRALTPNRARAIGAAARRRVLADHTYAQRATILDQLLRTTAPSPSGRGSG